MGSHTNKVSTVAKKELFIKANESFALRFDKDLKHVINIANEEGYSITCKRGCSACCYQIVTVNITDAVKIANRMISMSDSDIEHIRLSAVKATKINRKIRYDSQRWGEQIPCSFLSNNSCSIYTDRPIVCRATNTVEEEGYCEQLLQNKNLRGHEVLGVNPQGYSNLDIDTALLSPLIEAGLLNVNSPRIHLLCTQIDLDKLALLMAKPIEVRKLNLNKLISLDKKILNSLKKRSVNIEQEDEQVIFNRSL